MDGPASRTRTRAQRSIVVAVAALAACLALASPAAALVFTNSTAATIGPNAGTVTPSTIVVPAHANITSLNVGLILAHTFANDMDLTLTSPAGTVVELFTDMCGNMPWDVGATALRLNANAETVIGTRCPPAGNHRAEGTLANFTGQNPAGTWTLSITDDANVDQGVLFGWALDFNNTTVTPTPTIPTGPSGTQTSTSANFTFGGATSATLFCRLDASGFYPCATPLALTGLLDGSHTLEVRAVSSAGNFTTTPASRTWTIDSLVPDTFITDGPTGTVTNPDGQFAFAASEAGATFSCSLDGATPGACTSPQSFTGLATGEHTFTVSATDAAGNADASAASRTWTVAAPASPTVVQVPGPAVPGPPVEGPAAVSSLIVPGGLSGLLLRGLPTSVSCSKACQIVSTLEIPRRTAESVKLAATRPVVVGRATGRLARAGRKRLTVKLTRRARLRLARLRTLRVTVRTVVADAGGRVSPALSETLTLRR